MIPYSSGTSCHTLCYVVFVTCQCSYILSNTILETYQPRRRKLMVRKPEKIIFCSRTCEVRNNSCEVSIQSSVECTQNHFITDSYRTASYCYCSLYLTKFLGEFWRPARGPSRSAARAKMGRVTSDKKQNPTQRACCPHLSVTATDYTAVVSSCFNYI